MKLYRSKLFRIVIFIIGDIIILCASAILALLVRFEFLFNVVIHSTYFVDLVKLIPFLVITAIIVFYLFKLYTTMWSKASIREAGLIFVSCFTISILQIAMATMLNLVFPRSYYVLFFIFLYAFLIMWRFSYRIYKLLIRSFEISNNKVMIIGAGDAGTALLNEIKTSNHIDSKVVCFIDDNKYKIGKNLNGIKIVGDRYTIPKYAEKYNVDEIYLAIPTIKGKDKKEIIEIASSTNKKIKILPGIFQLVNGEMSVSKLRDIDIEDLLERDPIRINNNEILSYVENKTVLVTGAGGSIGSEICRQIAKHKPKKLIMIDIYENNIYDIQLELKKNYTNLDLTTLIASVRDEKRIDEIFDIYHPEIVFHAAAHKHVPLMEDSPNEAIKNNCQGTYIVAKMSDKYETKKFILISTDKAINPTNVMGASKRICEMITQYFSRNSKTIYALVRFGNVLGSNGSVVPLFKKQIEEGGPVTVTDENIIRYFMTIPEAVALVIQAGAYASGGEVFILDMGEPVKIIDMAKKLIKLSGYEPYADIDIKITGLRPGEKMYEELLMNEEGKKETNNNKIFIGKPIIFNDEEFILSLNEIIKKANSECKDIKEDIKKLVPTYHNS